MEEPCNQGGAYFSKKKSATSIDEHCGQENRADLMFRGQKYNKYKKQNNGKDVIFNNENIPKEKKLRTLKYTCSATSVWVCLCYLPQICCQMVFDGKRKKINVFIDG